MDFKYELNQKVRVVGYGHLIYQTVDHELKPVDIRADLIGQIGTIKERLVTQGKNKYALDGLSKTAWYDERQLEPVLPAPEG